MKTLIFLLGITINLIAFADEASPFHWKISAIPLQMKQQMKNVSWHPGCPVELDDLAYVKVSYYGFDQKTHEGELIVNKTLAKEVVEIFQELYRDHFPIASMQRMEVFKGDDDQSMAADNTSAFNCRSVTGKSGTWSWHAYGRAIDINTVENPYVTQDQVSPASGKRYLDRNKKVPGMITKNDRVYEAFSKRGWQWGGDWHDLKDYQHFEKKR